MTAERTAPADLARYRELVSQRPELFANPSKGGFRILLEEESMHAAEDTAAESSVPGASRRVGVVYEDEYVVLLRDAVAFPDGRLGTYIRMVGHRAEPTGVGVLPIHDRKVVLVRHFRHATRSHHWEIPRGFWVDGLTGAQIARQELEEELGISRCDLAALGIVHTNTGLTSESLELFAASVDSAGTPNRGQAIEDVAAVSVPDLQEMIRRGLVTDAFALAAYARAAVLGLLPHYE